MAAKKVAKPKKATAKKATLSSNPNTADVVTGLKYPWGHMGRLWNILWVLLPVLGWLALGGYFKRIVNDLVNGNKEGLPAFGPFWDNVGEGFWVFVKLVPLMIVLWVVTGLLSLLPLVGQLANLFIQLFIAPYLVIHFLVRGDFAATFDFKALVDQVFGNIKEYSIAVVKTVVYVIVYWVLSFLLIGIPCLYFGSYFYLAEFYAKHR